MSQVTDALKYRRVVLAYPGARMLLLRGAARE
jgi:hypothetical protein